REHHPAGIGPELPRPRYPAAAAELGQHADQRAGADLERPGAGDLAGADDLSDGDRLQLPRRRPAGRPRPARDQRLVSENSEPQSSEPRGCGGTGDPFTSPCLRTPVVLLVGFVVRASEGSTAMKIHPVILSGGSGTRLWPVSRAAYPRQLMALTSELTLLQETLRRVADDTRFAAPIVVCNDEHRFLVAEQARALGVTPAAILLEPVGRNTAPAIAAAAHILADRDPEAMMLMLPSDHYIAARDGFWEAVDRAARAAGRGALVTFGVTPNRPETGYGYIRRGEALDGCPGCFRVER